MKLDWLKPQDGLHCTWEGNETNGCDANDDFSHDFISD